MANVRMPSLVAGFGETARRWCERWFTGLNWNGAALIALVCLLNALRRVSNGIEDEAFGAWMLHVAEAFALGLLLATPVALAVVATFNLAPWRGSRRYAALAVAVSASCIAGVLAMLTFENDGNPFAFHGPDGEEPDTAFWVFYLVMQVWSRYVLLCALFTVVYVLLREADESAASAQQSERDRARFVQRMEEARLKVLEAQIEPHFLFNTLANVRRLYQIAPGDAMTMLDNLMRYFAVALPQMRAADSTLGREVDLTESYLNIQQIRMGRRLGFAIDIAQPLRDARIPPMMVLTLAENAIKHGLSPLPEGGFVRISAAVSGQELQVRVADSGRGFTQTSGGGTGLANIRARLKAAYGAAGRLTLAQNMPRGITATIAIPLSSSPSAAGGA